jgi:acyl-coenzyme A synthetase/AMP-(fatty) acid ligase
MDQVANVVPNVASTLIDALIASNRGDRHAFSYNDKRYSYHDVAALMNRTANLLRGLGVEAGARVLLLLPPSPARVAGVLGAIKAGAVPVLGVPSQAPALEHFAATVKPAAAIVHEKQLAAAEAALTAVPRDAVVVVGSELRGHKSFVEEVRGQASWLAAPDLRADAPALGIWTGTAVALTSHAELAAFVHGTGDLRGSQDDSSGDAATAGAMLRAFALGEEATLA